MQFFLCFKLMTPNLCQITTACPKYFGFIRQRVRAKHTHKCVVSLVCRHAPSFIAARDQTNIALPSAFNLILRISHYQLKYYLLLKNEDKLFDSTAKAVPPSTAVAATIINSAIFTGQTRIFQAKWSKSNCMLCLELLFRLQSTKKFVN